MDFLESPKGRYQAALQQQISPLGSGGVSSACPQSQPCRGGILGSVSMAYE